MSETLSDRGKAFKNEEKSFLFHVKSSSHSLDFLVMLEKRLIRKLRLISIFMMSQIGQQVMKEIM